jgi:hypothetical protein
MTLNDFEVSQRLNAARLGSVRIQGLNQLIFDDIDVYGARALN